MKTVIVNKNRFFNYLWTDISAKMLKLSRLSPNIPPLIAINCQSINRVIVRTKRNTFNRRPVKILTDSGKDYFGETDFKEPISTRRLEVNPNVFDREDKKKYNKYFDEGIVEDFEDEFDVEERQAMNEKIMNQKASKQKNTQKNDREVKQKKNKDMNERKSQKSETILKPKTEGIPAYQKLGERNTEFM